MIAISTVMFTYYYFLRFYGRKKYFPTERNTLGDVNK